MDRTRTHRFDAYRAVRGLVEQLRRVKLSDAEADSILWAAEGPLLANSPTDAEAVEARTAFDTLMDGLAAARWQGYGPDDRRASAQATDRSVRGVRTRGTRRRLATDRPRLAYLRLSEVVAARIRHALMSR